MAKQSYPTEIPHQYPPSVRRVLARSARRKTEGRWDGCSDTNRKFHATMYNLTLAELRAVKVKKPRVRRAKVKEA